MGEPGDETMLVHINDSEAGRVLPPDLRARLRRSRHDGTPVYIYVPEGARQRRGVDSLDPAFDQNPDDDFEPCADNSVDDYTLTQARSTSSVTS